MYTRIHYVFLQKQGQKLLAALNLPQVGVITLLQEDHAGKMQTLSFGRVNVAGSIRSLPCSFWFVGVCVFCAVDGPGLFTIELNERVYTIKASSHDEAAFWVDALLWRQAGGMVKKSLEVNKQTGGHVPSMDLADSVCSSAASTPTNSMYAEKMGLHHADVMSINPDNVGKNGAPCAACCVVQ